jgi:integrase
VFRSVKKEERRSYTREEVAAYWTASEHQSTAARRRYFRAALALGLGAGLSASEMVMASPHNLLYDGGHLCIQPPSSEARTRVVPIRRACVEVILDLAATTPNEQFAHKAPLVHSDPSRACGTSSKYQRICRH